MWNKNIKMNTLEKLQNESNGFEFIKSYPILDRLKLSKLQTRIIELVLSYQTNNNEFYMSYNNIAEILSCKRQSIKDTIIKLKKLGYISTVNSSNYNGTKGGSSTTITVNLDFIVNKITNKEVIETVEVAEEPSNEVIEDNDTNTPDSDFNPLEALKPFYNGDSERVMDYIKSTARSSYDLEDAEEFIWAFEEINKHQFSRDLGLKKLTAVTNNIII